MMKNECFFINIIPTNDRGEDQSYIDNVSLFVEKTNPAYFSYSLFTTGPKRYNPWALASEMMAKFSQCRPLIAVNPSLQSPNAIIDQLNELDYTYPKRVGINLVPGSFFNESKAQGDNESFESKQKKLHEFTQTLKKISNVKIFFSGLGQSQLSGNEESFFVQNIKPIIEIKPSHVSHAGLALGICARPNNEEAQLALMQIFPENRKGKMLFEMAVFNDETPWNKWIKEYIATHENEDDGFNLHPMKNFWSAAPFIVGSYKEVAQRLKKFHKQGYEFFVLDFHAEDFNHVEEVIKEFKL